MVRARDFEGCSFINVMLELEGPGIPVRLAAIDTSPESAASSRPRQEAGVADLDSFARQWHILMKGCIVAAAEGDRQAAPRAREVGQLLLAHHGIAA